MSLERVNLVVSIGKTVLEVFEIGQRIVEKRREKKRQAVVERLSAIEKELAVLKAAAAQKKEA